MSKVDKIIDKAKKLEKETEEIFSSSSFAGPHISLARALLFFYVTMSAAFTTNLFPKKFSKFVETNKLAQHVIAYLMLLILVITIGNIINIGKALIYSAIGYLVFLLTTKIDIEFTIMIIILLLFGFVYESKLLEDEETYKADLILTEMEKSKLMDKNYKSKAYIIIAVCIVAVIGYAFYLRRENKKNDFFKFLFY